jgi:anaphase-promoting complex subunit 8
MAAAVVTVDGEMIDSLRKAINDCADRGLLHASKWYACAFLSHPQSTAALPLPL